MLRSFEREPLRLTVIGTKEDEPLMQINDILLFTSQVIPHKLERAIALSDSKDPFVPIRHQDRGHSDPQPLVPSPLVEVLVPQLRSNLCWAEPQTTFKGQFTDLRENRVLSETKLRRRHIGKANLLANYGTSRCPPHHLLCLIRDLDERIARQFHSQQNLLPTLARIIHDPPDHLFVELLVRKKTSHVIICPTSIQDALNKVSRQSNPIGTIVSSHLCPQRKSSTQHYCQAEKTGISSSFLSIFFTKQDKKKAIKNN